MMYLKNYELSKYSSDFRTRINSECSSQVPSQSPNYIILHTYIMMYKNQELSIFFLA